MWRCTCTLEHLAQHASPSGQLTASRLQLLDLNFVRISLISPHWKLQPLDLFIPYYYSPSISGCDNRHIKNSKYQASLCRNLIVSGKQLIEVSFCQRLACI